MSIQITGYDVLANEDEWWYQNLIGEKYEIKEEQIGFYIVWVDDKHELKGNVMKRHCAVLT